MSGESKARLDDIRYLKLAEMYENAFEAFVLDISRRYVKTPAAHEKIEQLLDPRDDHAGRIGKELVRLNGSITPQEEAGVERAAILDIIEVERAAHDFYRKALEEVHDPAVAKLFRTLAREEERHARIAEDALAASDHASGRRDLSGATRSRSAESVPLWEGSVDLTRQHVAKHP